jgi:hypothetical protein
MDSGPGDERKSRDIDETPGVLDAGAFAIVVYGAETLLVCVERPREDQPDQTHKHSCKDQHVLNDPATATTISSGVGRPNRNPTSPNRSPCVLRLGCIDDFLL